MDDAERAFRDALHRVDSVKIPVPSLQPAEVRRGPGLGIRMAAWLAAAAVLALVAGIAVWAVAGRGPTVEGVPASRPTPVAAPLLTGTTWIAVEFHGKVTAFAPDKMPFLEFKGDSTFSGADPCNAIGGTYRLVGSELTITHSGSRLVGCNPPQQQTFVRVLEDTRGVSRLGDTIELLDQAGNTLARFRNSDSYTEPGPPGPIVVTPSRVPEPTPTATASASVVTIRVSNASDVDFESVEISFSGQRMTFGRVAAGKVSRFQKTDKANHFAPITVVTTNATYRFEESPSVGALLTPGEYTYALSIVNGELTLATTTQR